MEWTTRHTNPDTLAANMGVRVRAAGTPPGWWGVYDHDRRLVTLHPELGPIQRRCTLMHELGHAHYGHRHPTPKDEALADRWAARRLLDFDTVLDAVRTECRAPAIAAQLGVLPSVLDAFAATLTKDQVRELRRSTRSIA